MQRGERFRSTITALAATQGIYSDAALSVAAGVSANTLRNWWQGKGLELGTLVSVAGALDQSVFDLLNVWQGRETPKPATTVAEAIEALADELHAWRTEDRERIAVLERFVLGAGAARLGARKRRAGGASPKRFVPPKTAG